MYVKISAVKWRSICLGINMLRIHIYLHASMAWIGHSNVWVKWLREIKICIIYIIHLIHYKHGVCRDFYCDYIIGIVGLSFTDILQGLSGTGAIVWFHQCQLSNHNSKDKRNWFVLNYNMPQESTIHVNNSRGKLHGFMPFVMDRSWYYFSPSRPPIL